MTTVYRWVLVMMVAAISSSALAQDDKEEDVKEGYQFTVIKDLTSTPVKDQHRSGTCWSFSSQSFLESELIRMGKGEYDLSEMFVVRQTYSDKAIKYVRFQGNLNFGGGGAFHDVTHVFKHYGMVPESVFPGLGYGEDKHVHGELDYVAKGYIDAVIKNRNRKLSTAWHQGFEGILDAYLGEYPEEFVYEGKKYTPRSFADELGLNMDDYIEIGSYTHHPFYEKFILEVPDNWLLDEIYNVPLEEMMQVIDYAIENGFTIGWGSDVSEKGFSWKNGVAIVPEEEKPNLTDSERSKWDDLSEKEKKDLLYSFDHPVKEREITQEMRQEEFDNYLTTDDHGMHITGIAEDQKGNQYYIVKNSWGTDGNDYEGFFYASRAFVALKTIDIMVHKDAIPKELREKMGVD